MKTTLQNRLIILMVLSSVFLISAFTVIQLNNQLNRAHEFNMFKARQSAFTVSEQLRETFSSVGLKNLSPEESKQLITSEVKNIFLSLIEMGMIETAALLNREGNPVVLEGRLGLYFEDDPSFVKEISQESLKAKTLIPSIDKKHRVGNLFLIPQNPYNYIAKLSFSLSNLQEVLNEVYVPVSLVVAIIIVGNAALGTMLSKILISPVKLLNEATKDIAGGNLDRQVNIDTKDELEELAGTFNYMTVELKKMKQKAENANPLTKLPGNIVIQEEVEKKIKDNKKFALIYCDLDNFKAFNDKYGVHSGDNAIMLTADILKEAIAKEGKENDFIGHEGGDDFILLTVPERTEPIAAYVTLNFPKRINKLYSKEDLKRGYIESKSREGNKILKFPIMTISMAGVSNLRREITTYAQATNIAAEVKKAAKVAKNNKLIMDRRADDKGIKFRKGRRSLKRTKKAKNNICVKKIF